MIHITSDSTSDLGVLAKENDISIVPLKVILNTDTFQDGVDITPDKIFEFVDTTNVMPKTSAPSTEDYREVFERLTKGEDEVIHFNISSKCSAANTCAKNAAKNFNGKVRVIDSYALSSGQGLLVMKAVDMVKEGYSAAEIEQKINDLRPKVNTSFIPDRLDFLYKGGRCTKVQMIGATFFKLHPMIDMKDGILTVKKKYRGNMAVCIRSYISELKQTYPSYDKRRCFITHSHADRELVELARQTVKNLFNFEEIIETSAGSVVSGHCGRNTLGVLFIAE